MHRRTFITSATSVFTAASLARKLGAQETETREVIDVRGSQIISAAPQAVVSLGEEFLLADLLELGIKPVAAAGNYPDVYVGIDPELTEGLEPFSLWELDIESLLRNPMDLILVPESYYFSQQEAFDLVGELAPMVVVPDSVNWQEDFIFLASVFGKESEAEETIAAIEAEIALAADELNLEGQTASFATIYPGGGELALWLSDDLMIVEVGMALGLTVIPDVIDYDPDQIGRVRISLEQINVVRGETLMMLQTTGGLSPEEDQSYQELIDSTAFQSLPAVQDNRIFVIERVGFPGDISGRRNLLARYREIFAEG